MSECIVKIERLKNGYEIEMTDPAIAAQNKKSVGKLGTWKDPKVCYAFKTVDEVLGFLSKNLDKALPMDEYETAFTEAADKEDDD